MNRRIAILAGAGALPEAVAEAARSAGDSVSVLALSPRPDAAVVNVEDPAGIVAAIRAFNATHIILAGAVHLDDDARAALATFAGGSKASEPLNDTALSRFVTSFERLTGARVLGAEEVMPELLAQEGQIAGKPIDDGLHELCRWAVEMAREVGRLEMGQAVLTAGRRIIAAEDITGTDALLARVAEYRRRTLLKGSGLLILAKAARPAQPRFVDLPAIGPDTVVHAARAGVATIAVEAGSTLVIDRATVRQRAEELAVSIVGVAP